MEVEDSKKIKLKYRDPHLRKLNMELFLYKNSGSRGQQFCCHINDSENKPISTINIFFSDILQLMEGRVPNENANFLIRFVYDNILEGKFLEDEKIEVLTNNYRSFGFSFNKEKGIWHYNRKTYLLMRERRIAKHLMLSNLYELESEWNSRNIVGEKCWYDHTALRMARALLEDSGFVEVRNNNIRITQEGIKEYEKSMTEKTIDQFEVTQKAKDILNCEEFQPACEYYNKAWEAFHKQPDADIDGCMDNAWDSLEAVAGHCAEMKSGTFDDAIKLLIEKGIVQEDWKKLFVGFYTFENQRTRHAKNEPFPYNIEDAELFLIIASQMIYYIVTRYRNKSSEPPRKGATAWLIHAD